MCWMQLDGSQFYSAAESGLVLLKAKAPQPHCQVRDSAPLWVDHIINRECRIVYRVVACHLRAVLALSDCPAQSAIIVIPRHIPPLSQSCATHQL